jgi:hypothetical protein
VTRIVHPFDPLITGYLLGVSGDQIKVKCDDGVIEYWPVEWLDECKLT